MQKNMLAMAYNAATPEDKQSGSDPFWKSEGRFGEVEESILTCVCSSQQVEEEGGCQQPCHHPKDHEWREEWLPSSECTRAAKLHLLEEE
jgi:hypothetical protein